MKKFIKKRWFPLVVVIIGILVIGLILFLCGFRITYAPELDNSWEAVSAVASWVSVIMSFLAVMAAVWIPKRIADRQDKIALFEKRYELYYVLCKLCRSCDNLLQSYKQLDVVSCDKKDVYKKFYSDLVNNSYLEDIMYFPQITKSQGLFNKKFNDMNLISDQILHLFMLEHKESISNFFTNYVLTLHTLCSLNDKNEIIYDLDNLNTRIEELKKSYYEIKSNEILTTLLSQISLN